MIVLIYPEAIVSFYRSMDGGYSLASVYGRGDRLTDDVRRRIVCAACDHLSAYLARHSRHRRSAGTLHEVTPNAGRPQEWESSDPSRQCFDALRPGR